jgi:hypothetical protein
MSVVNRVVVVLSAVVLLAGTAPAFAQAPEAQKPAQAPPAAQKSMTAQGELVSVDADAKSIVVKTAAAEERFSITDKTEVVGAQKTVAGLATAKGSRVTVTYTGEGASKTATRIEVQAAK